MIVIDLFKLHLKVVYFRSTYVYPHTKFPLFGCFFWDSSIGQLMPSNDIQNPILLRSDFFCFAFFMQELLLLLLPEMSLEMC